MGDSRREFLRATTGILSGCSVAGSSVTWGAAQAPVRMRKDVTQLTATSPDIVALKTAVGMMKTGLGAGDRRNWVAQAQIHGTFTGGFTRCQHGN